MPETFTGQWSYVYWNDLLELSLFHLAVIISQVCLFFLLMFTEPSIINDSLPYCDKYRYISENISVQKGIASIMVFLMYPTWLVLVSISSFLDPAKDFFYRTPCIFLAVCAYSGSMNVLLYDQDIANTLSPVEFQREINRQHNMHVMGALQLCMAFIAAHVFIAFCFRPSMCMENKTVIASLWITRIFSVATIGVLALTAILYEFGNCKTTTVWMEYLLYFMIGATNVSIYLTYTAVHTLYKQARGNV